MFFQNLAFILPSFQFLLKRMLVFSHKMFFIKNEAALLCVTMQERGWAFVLRSSLQLFDVAFSIKKFSFCGALFKRILAWKRDISKK